MSCRGLRMPWIASQAVPWTKKFTRRFPRPPATSRKMSPARCLFPCLAGNASGGSPCDSLKPTHRIEVLAATQEREGILAAERRDPHIVRGDRRSRLFHLCPYKCVLGGGLLVYIKNSVIDRKSTRLNSSHRCISYAVFCLKKKKSLRTRAWSCR